MLGKTVIVLLRMYQYTISPFLGPKCRYFPTCSCYAIEAVQVHGAIYGSYLGAKRLLKCHPFCKGGVDLVPTADTQKVFTKKSHLKHEET